MRRSGGRVDWQALYGGPDAAGWWRWWVSEPMASAGLGREQIGGRCETLIAHCPPDHAMYFRDRYRPERWVSHTVWETDTIPPSWVPLLNGSEGPVDAVVVPTEWNAQTFREGGVEAPIFVIPHIAAPDELRASDADLDLDIDEDAFVFYMTSVWSSRKSVELAVEAFARAFTASDAVVLVIKSEPRVQHALDSPPPRAGAPESFAWWHLMQALRTTRTPPKVVLATEPWTDERIAALHRRGDCYFALPHGEGWGLGAFDAASLGKPVITSGWGGPVAYLGDEYPGLVSGRLVGTTALGSDRPANWFAPDVDHAVELLRDVVADRAERTSGVRRAVADRIARECSAERVAALFAAACEVATRRPLSPGRGGT
jgi:glycosyltransferase involved in cell wall biosynthesis